MADGKYKGAIKFDATRTKRYRWSVVGPHTFLGCIRCESRIDEIGYCKGPNRYSAGHATGEKDRTKMVTKTEQLSWGDAYTMFGAKRAMLHKVKVYKRRDRYDEKAAAKKAKLAAMEKKEFTYEF